MSEYVPDRWVVLEINTGKELIRKVFAGWYGGYADGDSWKLNSGNKAETEFDDRWEFDGYSGSKYICYKNNYGMGSYMGQVLSGWTKEMPDGAAITIVEDYHVHV
ncbi:hypothetical protein UFOVP250_56 [uncultured Caudovirales phage]|uniref:Uncharacterized protein n=1 Tax=uncultured Caudovirales phage TaxID=2100421 RepID=A0A6J5LJM9_9CAUD|nr:hypothetical protein UFOVP250_56 [uncultured Caudovirales phage]